MCIERKYDLYPRQISYGLANGIQPTDYTLSYRSTFESRHEIQLSHMEVVQTACRLS